jgi:two-component system response regulator MprA
VTEPLRILVVEDDAAIGSLLQDAMADEGYEVRHAPDGLQGLVVLESWRPNAIVLDLMMPVMDGETFRHEQRRRGLADDVPLLILSASRRALEVAADLGAAAVVRKPFDLDELVNLVNRLTAP